MVRSTDIVTAFVVQWPGHSFTHDAEIGRQCRCKCLFFVCLGFFSTTWKWNSWTFARFVNGQRNGRSQLHREVPYLGLNPGFSCREALNRVGITWKWPYWVCLSIVENFMPVYYSPRFWPWPRFGAGAVGASFWVGRGLSWGLAPRLPRAPWAHAPGCRARLLNEPHTFFYQHQWSDQHIHLPKYYCVFKN